MYIWKNVVGVTLRQFVVTIDGLMHRRVLKELIYVNLTKFDHRINESMTMNKCLVLLRARTQACMHVQSHAHRHTHTHTHTRTHAHTHTHTHTCTYTHTHARALINPPTHKHAHSLIHTLLFLCKCKHTRQCVREEGSTCFFS